MQENTEREFRWRGSLWPLFVGEHSFKFEPSKTTPGSTTFIDSEEFTGGLPWVMSPLYKGPQPSKQFDKFNEQLKQRVESLKGIS